MTTQQSRWMTMRIDTFGRHRGRIVTRGPVFAGAHPLASNSGGGELTDMWWREQVHDLGPP